MQFRLAMLCLAVLGACSSDSPTEPPPPPSGTSPTPGAPASVILVTGDGQSGAPATALPVKLSVQVRDAAGLVVPGVVVHFAIDSGAGSLSASALTTGADGTISGITWTLGPGSGTNVVAVTVGTLGPMRFHAQALGPAARTLFSSASTGSAGATLRYTRTGDALSGLSVIVPAGAYAAGAVWTIIADSSVRVPLPIGFSQVGPTLVIGNTQGFADSNMTLTMPMHLGADMAVAPFYFDPASGTLEGIPLVGRTDTSATLATRHFSVDLMAIPGQGAVGSLRASLRAGFGNVRVVWVAVPQAQLDGTYGSSFVPGVDDWEFINYGDFLNPHGDCEGMSISAMYYHYLFRLGRSPGPGLYHRYDQSLANQWDNVQGIRFSASVQSDYIENWAPGVNQVVQIMQNAARTGSVGANLTASWIILTLKLTGRPVLIALQAPGAGHAVVAYQVTSTGGVTTVWVADPNAPGLRSRVLTYGNGVMDPVNFQTNATSGDDVFTSSYALGVSAEVSMTQLASRWGEFTEGTAGEDRYPRHYRAEIENQLDGSWSTLTANVLTYSSQVTFRAICTDCASDPSDSIQQIALWNEAGSSSGGLSSFSFGNDGTLAFNAVEMARRGGDTARGFLDVVPITVVHRTLSVSGPDNWSVNTPLVFKVDNPPDVAGAHYQFEWNFGDNTDVVEVNDNPEATHTFQSTGKPTVTVSIKDLQTGHLIARGVTGHDVVALHWVWTIDASSQTGVANPPTLTTSADTLEVNTFNGYFADLQANPSHWVFFAVDSGSCQAVLLEQFPDPHVNSTSLVTSAERTVVAASSQCLHAHDPDTGAASIGTVGSGTITGNLTPLNLGNSAGVLGGTINAQMAGKTLSGTFTWIISFASGYATYSYTFSGHQVAGP